jgi:aminoglycoside/choline kinase family phosphotransferase
MKTDILLRQTRIHFPRFDADTVKITPIEKGGSDRRFYRVHSAAEQKLILVKYDLEREENRQYVEIAKFLDAHGVRAPKIYYHDAEEGLIWIEDLGEDDLFSHRDESWLVRRAFYESALDEVAKLHRISEAEARAIRDKLPVEFNESLYLWEQSYFFENCLGRYLRVDQATLRDLAALPALNEIARQLDGLSRVLVHRDFQSQNIIVRNGLAYLIDFQGMRPGLAEYDLASLFFDPYVDLSESERSELVRHYLRRQREHGVDVERVETVLPLCAIQRLMQALGAYGFLGLVKQHAAFLKHVPAAINSLQALVSGRPGLEELDRILTTVMPLLETGATGGIEMSPGSR